MIYVQPVEFPGIDGVLSNSEYYKDKFINDSVICFRNANLTEQEQFKFCRELGSLFGWSLINDESKYVENHERKSDIVSGPDDIIVEWHVEHTYYANPIVASTWNMYNFKTDNENGKTYFIDTNVVFEMLTDDEKQFLLNSRITEPDEHWLTGKPIIRFTILPQPCMVRLVSYKGTEPSQDDLTYFETIIRKIEYIIWNNEDIRIVHKWQQGDLVIPDMFKLAHAVTGGFKAEDREFRGIWGYKESF